MSADEHRPPSEDEADLLEARLRRQSRRTRMVGAIAASAFSLLILAFGVHALLDGNLRSFVTSALLAAFGFVGAARLFRGQSTEDLRWPLRSGDTDRDLPE